MNDSVLECLKAAINAVNFGSYDYSKVSLYENLNNCEEFMKTLEAESKRSFSSLFDDYKDLEEAVFCIKLSRPFGYLASECGDSLERVVIETNKYGRIVLYPNKKETDTDFAKRVKDVMKMTMKGLPDYEQGDEPKLWWKVSIYGRFHGKLEVKSDDMPPELSSDEFKYAF